MNSIIPKIIIAGKPASGKGTLCDYLKNDLHLVHLSAGDMLRDAIKSESEIGLKVKEYVEIGALVPDDIVIEVVLARLKDCLQRKEGWLLDGYPRTSYQAEAMKSAGFDCDAFIQLDVVDEILLERVTGRRLDPETGKIYHMKYLLPESDDVRLRLVQRKDDTEEAFHTRIEAYYKNMPSVLSHFTDKVVSVKVTSSEQTPEEIYKEIKPSLEEKLVKFSQQKQAISLSGGGSTKKVYEDESVNVDDVKPDEPADVADAKPEEPVDVADAKPDEPVDVADAKPDEPVDVADAKPEEPADVADANPEDPVDVADAKPDEEPVDVAGAKPEEKVTTVNSKVFKTKIRSTACIIS